MKMCYQFLIQFPMIISCTNLDICNTSRLYSKIKKLIRATFYPTEFVNSQNSRAGSKNMMSHPKCVKL